MSATETEADDGAIHRFWRFVIRRRLEGHTIELETLEQILEAIEAFEREEEQ